MDPATETRALLQISEEESRQVDAAIAKTLQQVRQIELSHLRKETHPDGSPLYIVSPWASEGGPAMAALEANLASVLGESRAAILFREIRSSAFLAGGTHTLLLSPRIGPIHAAPFSNHSADSKRLNVEVGDAKHMTQGPDDDPFSFTRLKHDEPIWLEHEDTSRILERYGHILGVETVEDLDQLFDGLEKQ